MSARRGRDGRRRYEPDWGPDGSRRHTRIGRLILLLGALVLLASIGLPLLQGESDHEADGPTVEATADAAPAAASGAAIATSEPRAFPDEWYREELNSADLVPVSVIGVIDGDTLDVEVGGVTLRVRAYGFDTPERGERCYDEALERLEALVGDRVFLLADQRLQDPSRRELRYLFTLDGLSIDAVMVGEGYAEAWRADGSMRDSLRALEREAREAGKGCLWSEEDD